MKTTICSILLAASITGAHAQAQQAAAQMINTDEQDVGTVTFNTTKSGLLHVIVEMTNIAPGPHGFHVHETGKCSAADGFKSAGGHYAGSKEHGVESEGGPHPGDFPNVNVGQDGIMKVEFFTDQLSLREGGENPLMDADGSAVVVHAGIDDYSSQPSGDAGERIACGVISQ